MAPTPDPAALGALTLELAGNVSLKLPAVSFAAIGLFLENLGAGKVAVLRTESGQVVAASSSSFIAAEWDPA